MAGKRWLAQWLQIVAWLRMLLVKKLPLAMFSAKFSCWPMKQIRLQPSNRHFGSVLLIVCSLSQGDFGASGEYRPPSASSAPYDSVLWVHFVQLLLVLSNDPFWAHAELLGS